MIKINITWHNPRISEAAEEFDKAINWKNHKPFRLNNSYTQISSVRNWFKKTVTQKLHKIKPGKIY
jgi:hypothetical protein